MEGRTLAHYEILERLGAGGMGEVYRARDTRLGREVALKILPEQFAEDPSRLARFEREARAIAALNHPNIVTVHSVEEADGVRFLSMELVEGQTLSRILPKDGLPLERFFDLAIPLADALAAAHAKNITHRDLKPANIMVDGHGRLKVLDFGLAKLLDEADLPADDVSSLRTRTMGEPLTGEGRIVGTPQYMSPEQAAGDRVDSRSDIFSLGTVLYEMATGACPFKGDSRASVVSSILRDTPSSVTELNRALPRPLGRIVMRCLAKDPDRRFQTALDVRNELQELRREIDSGELERGNNAAFGRSPRTRRRIVGAAIVLLVAIISGAVVLLQWRPTLESTPTSNTPRVRFTQLTDSPNIEALPTISSDGRMVMYVGGDQQNSDIFLQRTDGKRAIDLTADSPLNDTEPALSPNGSHIAFRSEREGGGIFIMGATGESPRRIIGFGHYPTWSPDGRALALSMEEVPYPTAGPEPNAIWIVDVQSGQAKKILEQSVAGPAWSPHGSRLAYWAVTGGERDIWTVKPDGGDPRQVTHDRATDWWPQWSPDGGVLYFLSDRGGASNIWRVSIDEASGIHRGDPEPVTTGTSEILSFALSRDGRHIASSVSTYQSRLEKLAFDPARAATVGSPIKILLSSASAPDVSGDNRKFTYMVFSPHEDIAAAEIDGTRVRQLTDDPYRDRFPRWSPQGERIAFFSNRSGNYQIWTIRVDGSDLRQETDVAGWDLVAPAWAPNGKRLSCGTFDRGNYIIDLTTHSDGLRGADELQPMPRFQQNHMQFFAGGGAWSPDGNEFAGYLLTTDRRVGGIALYSFDTRAYRVVRTFDPPLSFNSSLYWLPDGHRIAYTRDNDLVVLDSDSGKERVVAMSPPSAAEFLGFSLSPDGSVLLVHHGTANVDIWLVDLGPASG
jgi:serine/threonine protein kinase/WD40 repeat protein